MSSLKKAAKKKLKHLRKQLEGAAGDALEHDENVLHLAKDRDSEIVDYLLSQSPPGTAMVFLEQLKFANFLEDALKDSEK